MESSELLEMKAVSKRFPGVQALDQVDFDLAAGEVHALVGENGAGKSTLMRILCGAYQPDDGEIYLSGERVVIQNPAQAQSLGISIVYQEFSLFANLPASQINSRLTSATRPSFISTNTITFFFISDKTPSIR